MNFKIVTFLIIISLVTIIPAAYAQITISSNAEQKSVEVTISSRGDVHVKHVINPSITSKQVELIYGTVSNITVTDENGNKKQFSVIGQNESVLINPSQGNSVLEYDLQHAISQKDGMWTWSFRYLETTSFILPEEVEIVFANDRPINMNDKKGITCHGCQMILEYSIEEPKIFEDVMWEDKKFLVEIRSHSNVDKFIFDQPSKSITFEVLEENKFVTVIIPLELLWEPYSVFLDNEKIFFHDYINNGTHVWVSMRPQMTGEIIIIGTTVVPEFSMMIPFIIGFFVILALPFMKKVSLH